MTAGVTQSPESAKRSQRVESILTRVHDLPTLSPVATRLLAVGRSRDADMKEIVKLIESDPALSTRLLALCRRADKGLGERITTVKRAVLMLGFESVRSAALSVAVYDHLRRDDDPTRAALDHELAAGMALDLATPAFDRQGYWQHLLAVACAAESIAEAHPKLRVQGSEVFLAGLLHGIGKLALDLMFPKAYSNVLRIARLRCRASAEVELQVFGLDHCTVGERLAHHWELPPAVIATTLMHAFPPNDAAGDTSSRIVSIVSVAKRVCRELHLGWSGDFDTPPNSAGGWRTLGLDARGPTAIIPALLETLADRCEVLGLGKFTPLELLTQGVFNANQRLVDAHLALGDKPV
ncbi:MAG: HDOD domain-containing protein [Planctomycetes bacterium]|nr:HDOD domain-containing protein [Planctomycetota bacterium]